MLTIRLPIDLEKRLTDLSARIGKTKIAIVREAILEHIDDLEDLYLAEKIHLRAKSGEEQIFTLEEVEAELGSHCVKNQGFWHSQKRPDFGVFFSILQCQNSAIIKIL